MRVKGMIDAMKKTAFVLIFLGVLFSLPAMDYERLLEAALQNDRQMVLLEKSLENQDLRIQRDNLEMPFSLTVGTGTSDVSVTQTFPSAPSGSSTSLSLNPRVSMNFGDPYGTEIGLDLPVTLLFPYDGAPAAYTLSPSVSVSQPLNPLIGLEESEELGKLEDFYALEQKRISLLSRRLAVQKSLLNGITGLKVLERNIIQADRDIESAVNELEKTKTLGTYSRESAKFRQLEVGLLKLKREMEILVLKQANKWQDLEEMIGISLDKLPENLPESNLDIRGEIEASWSPSLYLAGLEERIAELRLEQETAAYIPRLSVGGSYGMKIEDFSTISNHNLSGSFEGIFEDFSVYGSFGGSIDGKSITATFGFSWSLPDRRASELMIRELENSLDIARLNTETAEELYRNTLEALEMDVLEMENRIQDGIENREITELELKEAEARFEHGIINKDSLDASRWKLKKIAYDEYSLMADKLLLSCDLSGLLLLKER
jgi:hypothetical protein